MSNVLFCLYLALSIATDWIDFTLVNIHVIPGPAEQYSHLILLN